ncbi:MAG: DUF4340 domain-containing protein [Cyanobacteria bacterium P01_D01_bin.36]
MLKRGTLLLLLSAIALGGAVLLLENKVGPSASTPSGNEVAETATEKVIPFEEEEIEAFSIVRSQQSEGEAVTEDEAAGKEVLSFQKNEDSGWQMIEPEGAIAEGGAIAFLLNQLTNPTAVPVSIDPNNLEEFGLATPEATIAVTVGSGAPVEYQIQVGGLDFSQDKRYVQVTEASAASSDSANVESEENEQTDTSESDQANAELKVYAVSGSIINAVNRPTAEWLATDADAPAPDTSTEDATE